jgi:hypothetical protein
MTSGIKVKVVKDSISKGQRLTTLQLRYHRYIHGEFMTHRVFSRNASSSRAIPVKTMLKQVWSDPAIPVHWGANQPGMQARKHLEGFRLWAAKTAWILAAKLMCVFAWLMVLIGLHKQIANRILEPWQFIHVIVSATDWDNFFLLRDHPDAQPEIRELAREIKYWMDHSTPTELKVGDYHLPYITDEEFRLNSLEDCVKMSTARCARVSYLTHDGKKPSKEKDIKLHDDLVVAEPIHASPSEHQATPAEDDDYYKNFRGWIQYRTFVEMKKGF